MRIMRQRTTGAIVITGASSGIGEACALHLDKLGFQVFAGVRRERDGAALQNRASNRLIPVLLDVTNAASITSAVDTVTTTTGGDGLVGLINNAGLAVAGPLEFLPVNDIREQLEVNVIGQIAVTQAFLPLLRQGQGRIVNIGSLGGRIAVPFLGPYHASKFAMEALTDSLRCELRSWGIQVSIVEAGIIATPLWEKSITALEDTLKNLPPSADRLYSVAIRAGCEIASKVGKAGSPSNKVIKKITHALTAKRPRTRYLVGRGTKLGTAVFIHFPDRLRDFIIAQLLPKSSKTSEAD